MPVPTDKLGVQRLLGMVRYVQKFAPKLAEITTPLRDLIKKGNELIWEEHVHGKRWMKSGRSSQNHQYYGSLTPM